MMGSFVFVREVDLAYGLVSPMDLTNFCKIRFPYVPWLLSIIDILLQIRLVFLEIPERLASLLFPSWNCFCTIFSFVSSFSVSSPESELAAKSGKEVLISPKFNGIRMLDSWFMCERGLIFANKSSYFFSAYLHSFMADSNCLLSIPFSMCS